MALTHEQILKRTEDEVLELLASIYTEEDLFKLRIDVGLEYIYDHYRVEKCKGVIRSKAWWKWWRFVWHQGDKKVLATWRKAGCKYISLEDYMLWHKGECQKWFVPANLEKQLVH